MEYLNWELSVLSRAVAYTNLSGAASHVGLSQPQLSRIVARMESQLGIVLLDREARRRSAWTPAAYKVAEIYNSALKQFKGELQQMVVGSHMTHVRVGTLEGLTGIALEYASHLFKKGGVRLLEIRVEDLGDLEEGFSKRNLDVILTFREPGRKKFKYIRKLGYQTLAQTPDLKGIQVMSSFEYGTQMQDINSRDETQTLVSNSLEVRRSWISKFGGHGILPSEIRPSESKPGAKEKSSKGSEVPVLIIGAEDLPPAFWESTLSYKP
jgi:LysR family transcriptional regulator, transcriptional activator for aaeXAB operon